MTKREEKFIDSIVDKTLTEMLEWDDLEITTHNVYLFAANKLDYPVTEEEVESALVRKLSRKFKEYSFEYEMREYGNAIFEDLRRVAIEQGIPFEQITAETFCATDWEHFSFHTLQAIHKEVLYMYGAPDLLYE